MTNFQQDDGDDYWNDSSVKNRATRQAIFDADDSSAIERFKSRSNPFVENVLASTNVKSARFRPTEQTKIVDVKSANSPVDSSIFSKRFNPPIVEEKAKNFVEPRPKIDQFAAPTNNEKLIEKILKNLEKKDGRLESFRRYEDKVLLLRVATQLNTPNVFIPVLIFLENSLSRNLFYELIKDNSVAITNYISMAKLRFEKDYFITTLKNFGRNENVAMIRLDEASRIADLNRKLSILDQAATELASHPWWHLQVAEQRQHLIKQREFQASGAVSNFSHRTALESHKAIFENDFRRQKQTKSIEKSIFDRSREFENVLHMSPAMIMCSKLTVVMHCGLPGHYEDFVHQAIHQGVFGKKYVVAPEYLADMMNNWVQYNGEPMDKANEKTGRFLNMIADPERRIYFAEKFSNYDVAIETIVNVLRDRTQLENLRKRMPNDHPAFYRATSLLENTKWKN